MTHPMPDQTTDQPPKRMTTAEVAGLAQQIDGRLDDLAAVVTDLAGRLDERATAHAELRDDLMGRLSGVRPDDAATRDQVQKLVHEALQPLHEEVHELRGKLAGSAKTGGPVAQGDAILTRLEDAERKLVNLDADALTTKVAAEMHPALSALRKRLDGVAQSSGVVVDPEGLNALGRRVATLEATLKMYDADPVAHTLAEDALSDQIQEQVRQQLEPATAELSRMLNNALSRLDRYELEMASIQGLLNGHPNASRVLAQAPGRAGGTGAAKKVLQLMRAVTHIGKEKEANLGERGGRFMFRGVDDAMDAVGHAMREIGVILGTEILKDETTHNAVTKGGEDRQGRKYENTVIWTTSKLTVRYTFTDPDDGSTHAIEMTGEGRDASDKSTSKAASMALKYGLFQALMIPVTGLDDSDAAPPQRIEQDRDTPAQQQRPPAQPPAERTEQQTAQRAGEALQAIRNVYRVEGGAQAQYNRLVQIMNQVKQEGLLEYPIEGATLDQHGQAAMRTLQAPPPPDDARASTEPPEPPEDYR